jgi:hypothetical protein
MHPPLPPRALTALRALRVYGDHLPYARRRRLIFRVVDGVFAERPEITRLCQMGSARGFLAGRARRRSA